MLKGIYAEGAGLVPLRSFVGLQNTDGGHAGSGCALNAHISVFEDETIFGSDAEAVRGGEKSVGCGLGTGVVFGADEEIEAVEQADGGERPEDRLAGAAGDDREGDAAMLGVDVLEDFGDGLEAGKVREVEVLFAMGDSFDGHVEALHFVEPGNDLLWRHAAPGIEETFVEGAAPLAERFFPREVVEGHGVDDGAVAVEEVGAKEAGWQLKGHCAPRWWKSLMEVCAIPGPKIGTWGAPHSCLGWGTGSNAGVRARRRARRERVGAGRLRRAWWAASGARC